MVVCFEKSRDSEIVVLIILVFLCVSKSGVVLGRLS